MALLLTLFFCALTLFGQVFYLFQSDAPLIELVLGSLPTFGAALLLCGTYAMLGRESELQRRGLFRTEYSGSTLREHLGLQRPVGRFAGRNLAAAE